jgi:hypothetical protein
MLDIIEVLKGNFVLPEIKAFLPMSILFIKKIIISHMICPFFIGAIQI